VQNILVKYAPFHSWFMILTRKLLKLDFLASVNLILKYRRVPRCTGNKGKAVPLNSKQALRGDVRYGCTFRERHPVSIVQEAEWADLDSTENLGPTGVSIAGPYCPYLVAIPTTVSVPSHMPTGRGIA
jgi:hypothetical protein